MGTEQERGHVWLLDTRRELGRLLGRLEVSSPERALRFLLSVGLAIAAYLAGRRWGPLEEAPARGLCILVLAAALWVSEATPAYAVGILVIGLQVLLLGNPAQGDGEWTGQLAILGHPLIWLFFGGFVLAAGTARTGLDRVLASFALTRFGPRPSALLAGVMCVTFGFSMFMSNTATTALMLALLAPVVGSLKATDPFRRALLLGTAIAANVGGMGSLIGTPPNAIAAGALAGVPGQSLGFLRWLLIGLPPASLLSIGGWLYLLRRYPADLKQIDIGALLRQGEVGQEPEAAQAVHDGGASEPEAHPPRWQHLVVIATGLVTVALWVTGSWHRGPTAVVSLLPVVIFTTAGVLSATDLRRLPWDVLFLLAGGLALGSVIKETGLATWMVAQVPTSSVGVVGLTLGLCYCCVVLSNFMSNTAAAGVLIPIGVTLSAGYEGLVVLPLALSASAAMCLPIATPPNALVFASGGIESKEFLRPGILLGLITPPLTLLWTSVVGG